MNNIVLVHGGCVDGAGWEGVYRVLKADGYNVSVVQNPTTSLADDVAATKRVLAVQDGPAVLVGHSYGGAGGPGDRGTPQMSAPLGFPLLFPPTEAALGLLYFAKPPPPGPLAPKASP